MLISSLGYELGRYVIKPSEKPFGLQRILSRVQPSSYPGQLFNLLFNVFKGIKIATRYQILVDKVNVCEYLAACMSFNSCYIS